MSFDQKTNVDTPIAPDNSDPSAVGGAAWVTQESDRLAAEMNAATEPDASAPVVEETSADAETVPKPVTEEPATEVPGETESPSNIKLNEYDFGGKKYNEEMTIEQLTEAARDRRELGTTRRVLSDLKKDRETDAQKMSELEQFKTQALPILQKLSNADAETQAQILEAIGHKQSAPNPEKMELDNRFKKLEASDAQRAKDAQFVKAENLVRTAKQALGLGSEITQNDLNIVIQGMQDSGISEADIVNNPRLAATLYAANHAASNVQPDGTKVTEAAAQAAAEVEAQSKAEGKLPPPGSAAPSKGAERTWPSVDTMAEKYQIDADAGHISQEAADILIKSTKNIQTRR